MIIRQKLSVLVVCVACAYLAPQAVFAHDPPGAPTSRHDHDHKHDHDHDHQGKTTPTSAKSQDEDPNLPKQWYRGNLHTHSLWSDGNDFPEMIVDWYVRNDYDFLALSDHNILSVGQRWVKQSLPDERGGIQGFKRYVDRFGDEWVESRTRNGVDEVRLKPLGEFRSLFEQAGEFLLIQSEELSDHFQQHPIHINIANIRDVIRPQGGDSVRDTIANNLKAIEAQRQRHGQPMLPHLNHPNFGYAVTAEDIAAVIEERFFEVYNGHPSINHNGDDKHVSIERLWDIANTLRIAEYDAPPLYGVGTDDSHNYFGQRGSSPGRGWVMVHAAFLTPESLIHAMERGDFYASSGVTLADVRFDAESGTYTVEVEPVEGEEYDIEFVGTRAGFDPAREPRMNDAGEPIRTTHKYSSEIGEVLQSTENVVSATDTLSGDELYVRAVVTSSATPENPAFDGQFQQAWTQPFGWEAVLAKKKSESEAASADVVKAPGNNQASGNDQ